MSDKTEIKMKTKRKKHKEKLAQKIINYTVINQVETKSNTQNKIAKIIFLHHLNSLVDFSKNLVTFLEL